MGEKRCGDKDLPLLPEADLIQVLVWLPVVSLLRLKAVCKSWCALIESSLFIDLHTTATTFKSSSSRFGSFIVHAAVEFPRFRENALLMLSSVSESECVSKSGSEKSWCSGSLGCWSTGFNGVCGRCVPRSGGWWWNTNDGLCGRCGRWNSYRVAEDDHKVFKVDNFLGAGGGSSNDNDDQLVLKLDNLGFPLLCYNFGKIKPTVMVVGSCNGLICLHDSERRDVSLWNPATRQFRILPKSITIAGDGDDGDWLHRLFAFGFDAKTKDYKVVLVTGFKPRRWFGFGAGPMECTCRVQVYSSSTDSWRLLKGINLLPGSPFPYQDDSSSSSSGLYLNGSCFFLAKFLYSSEQCIPDINDRFMISLDLTKEIIIPIQLPHHRCSEELYLCYLGKKIALFTAEAFYAKVDNHDTPGYYEFFSIFVLNEHGCSSSSRGRGNETWTELHCFKIKQLGLPGEWNIPRGISNDGVFALLESTVICGGGGDQLGNNQKKKKEMKLYNLVTKEVKNNFIPCDQVLSKAYAYQPSLVSIEAAEQQPMMIWCD